ncbi:MAG: tyrosine-type recombinase/integrase [Deltaproteobacteria bacterium]|nr:tyrosine-type recombinase/integrase [Deltaproteobacteria bacterium]
MPDAEGVPELPRRESQAPLAREERRVGGEALAARGLPRAQARELPARTLGEHHLLQVVGAAPVALEHAQEHAPLRRPRGVEDAADVGGDELVSAQVRVAEHRGQRLECLEVIHLTAFDLDQERGTPMVRQGKSKKDRMVPIGERAIAWIARYLNEARPQLVAPPNPGTIFLTQEGEEISSHRGSQLVRDHVAAADLGKTGACHLFRHTCATLMLEGGADSGLRCRRPAPMSTSTSTKDWRWSGRWLGGSPPRHRGRRGRRA